MGWPNCEAAEDYRLFYPGTVLETGYDILFFWVARMIMMGLWLTGKSPFEMVYLHGLVRDGEGRKMSKTVGNVIDPLDAIQQYGTDAVRYSLVTGCTPGQDVPLSLERVEANRNFANKLWNATRFLLGNLDGVEAAELAALGEVHRHFTEANVRTQLALPERYIVSGLHQLVARVTAGFESYSFGDAGQQIYSFLWDEFADWYIEVSKVRMRDGGGGGGDNGDAVAARRTLVYVLDSCLRLLHPFMPFVTEALFQRLPRGSRDGDASAPSSIMTSAWPSHAGYVDADAVQMFGRFQALVRSIRHARAEYGVEPSRKIDATVVASSREVAAALRAERPALAALARVDENRLRVVLAGDVDSADGGDGDGREHVHLIVDDTIEAYLPMRGLVDVERERARLERQRRKVDAELDGIRKRLSSRGFVDKAPAQVVHETRTKAAELEETAETIARRLDALTVPPPPASSVTSSDARD